MAYGSSKGGGYGADIPVIRRAQSGHDGEADCAFGAPALGHTLGKVRTAAGDVTITRPGAGAFRVSAGDGVFATDLIETGPDGRVTIAFVDGSEFRLGAGAAFVLEESSGAETARGAALLRLLKGVFAFVTGRTTLGRFAIDTPVGRIQASAPAIGIGSLTFGALTLGLIHDLKAASADIGLLDDGTIDYKDLKHGVFEIRTKEAHPRIIVVDDPTVTIELKPRGGGTVGVDEVANTPAQMAQLQSAFQSAYSTFTQGQQDPFMQQLLQGPNDHANAQPQSAPSSVGSSTAASDLNSGGQGLGQIGGTQLALNSGGGPTGTLPVAALVVAGTTTTSTTLPPGIGPTSTVEWIANSGNWSSANDWSDGIVPGSGNTVQISGQVTVSSSESTGELIITSGATLEIVAGGSFTIAGNINNSGTIVLDDPPLKIVGLVQASGGGVVTMLGSSAVNVIFGAPGTGATLDNVNNTIFGTGSIGQGADGNLTFENYGTVNANVSSQSIVIDTGNQVTNAGTFEASGGGTLTIDDPLKNDGTLSANGGIIQVLAAVTGAGSASVSGGGTFELGVADAQALAVSGAGTLMLDAGSNFSGNVTLAADTLFDLAGAIADFTGNIILAAGDIIDLAGINSVTSVEVDGSNLFINGAAESFTIAGLPTGDTFAFKSDGSGGTDLAVLPQVLKVSTSPVSGSEGSAIALDIQETLASGATLTSFTLSDIPSGATLTNANGDTFTITNGTITFTAAQIAAGVLNGLSITLANSESFTLHLGDRHRRQRLRIQRAGDRERVRHQFDGRHLAGPGQRRMVDRQQLERRVAAERGSAGGYQQRRHARCHFQRHRR
jgi:FecR protein